MRSTAAASSRRKGLGRCDAYDVEAQRLTILSYGIFELSHVPLHGRVRHRTRYPGTTIGGPPAPTADAILIMSQSALVSHKSVLTLIFPGAIFSQSLGEGAAYGLTPLERNQARLRI